ncbi:MAG: hypothetical protein GWP10_06970 [Nitrospiraceae bacterium]|nr:hypothetical protein [Nitrospiraceae bacterium]
MTTRYMTRAEIIADLPQVFREYSDLGMDDKDLAVAWMNYGIHAGTHDWNDVCVDRLYYNKERGDVGMLSMFRGWQSEDIPREEFDVWAGENLTSIEYFGDEYGLDRIIEEFGEIEGKYRVTALCGEDIPEFPEYIPQTVWDDIEAYNDLFSEIHTRQDINLATAIVQLKLLRGHSIPEVGWDSLGGEGVWDIVGNMLKLCLEMVYPYNTRIIRVEQST